MIQSVTGILPPEALTFCQCHEHILLSKGVSWQRNHALCMEDIQKSMQELLDYRAAGGSTIVDAQPVGCNRMTKELVQLSRDSGVQIVASTGFHKVCFYPAEHWIHTYSQQQLTEVYFHELTKGMYVDTDNAVPSQTISAKAGMIKTALDAEFSLLYEKLFHAAASAQCVTGAPLMIPVEMGSDPIRLFKFLSDCGVPAESMLFCHMDRSSPDLRQHHFLLKQGAYLEYDTIGRFKYHSDQDELQLIQQVLDWGFERQLLLSLDTTAQRLKHYTPDGIGLTYLLHSFLPMLKNSGVPEKTIDKICRENCASALRWKPKSNK